MSDFREITEKLLSVSFYSLPLELQQLLDRADQRCRRAGGALVSRQAIVAIVVAYETAHDLQVSI